jgi:uncharacterized membrane protein YccC
MTHAAEEPGSSPSKPWARWGTALSSAGRTAAPPLLFGLRLWASVCLALWIAFYLELEHAYWAGLSAAIVCQPELGASLRKGWYRMLGTLVGAVAVVALTALFPQARAPFLVGLALWGAVCAGVATILRNFAAYSAALAGYTAVIVAADALGATGGPNANAVFMLAVTRATEICIGIVSAGIVLAGTDLGGARRRLAASFAALPAEITGRFLIMLIQAGPDLPETQPLRRELLRRVIALEPAIDAAKGESSQIRYHSPVLQMAVDGLFSALAAWRTVAALLADLAHDEARAAARAVLERIPHELRATERGLPGQWVADPAAAHAVCAAAVRSLQELPAGAPTLRLLADQTAAALSGIADALNGLALLSSAPVDPIPRDRHVEIRVPDWLPAFISAARSFVLVGAIALFWILSEWPSGGLALAFAAIVVNLFSTRVEQAYATAADAAIGILLGTVLGAVIKFAVLPGLESFEAFSLAIGLYLVPVGALATQSWRPALFSFMVVFFCAYIEAANVMSYDTMQYYNNALGIVGGSIAAALSFRLIPPLSPAVRTRRLLGLALRDLRRLAAGRASFTLEAWRGLNFGRLAAMPEAATPPQRANLLAALTAGLEIIQLRRLGAALGLGSVFEPALDTLAQGRSAEASAQLSMLSAVLAPFPRARDEAEAALALEARGSIVAITGALSRHGPYFDAGD